MQMTGLVWRDTPQGGISNEINGMRGNGWVRHGHCSWYSVRQRCRQTEAQMETWIWDWVMGRWVLL